MKYEYLSVHPRQKEFLLFLCAIPQFISKNADGERDRPIEYLLGEFEVERWFIQGLGEKVDPESVMLISSASMSYDDLVGHTGDACKRAIDCKGDPTCDERTSLESPAFGHLYQLNLLIQGGKVEHGLYGICWHMGSAILHVVSQEMKGFRHSAFKRIPPPVYLDSGLLGLLEAEIARRMAASRGGVGAFPWSYHGWVERG